MIIVSGTASTRLARELAKVSAGELAKTKIKRFPDGECYARIETNLEGQDVVLVQTSYPDEKIVELFILQDVIRERGAKSLTTVVPYYGYARQDKIFQAGEGISARAMAKHIQNGSDKVITVDIHTTTILDWFDVPCVNVSVMDEVGRFLKDKYIDVIIAPDKGALERARTVAKVLGCEWDHLEKTRIDGQTVEMKPKNLKAQGKSFAIVDDIIATGGTIVKATQALKSQGAKRVVACCAHGLYAGGALPKLQASLDGIYSADTIENPSSAFSAASAIWEELGK